MPGSSNYFGIPNPDDFYCTILRYDKVLVIGVQHLSLLTVFRISFTVPIYINCPMEWRGVDFRLGSAEELEEIAIQLAKTPSDAIPLKEYELYIAEVDKDMPKHNFVRILAIRSRIEVDSESEKFQLF